MPLYIAAQCQQGDLLAGKRAGEKTGGAEQPRAANHALWGNGARLCKSHSETRFSDQLYGDTPQWQKIYVGNVPQQYDHEPFGGFYRHWGNGYIVEHQEGSVEEVSNWVASGQTEIGIVYIAQRQLAAFRHILGHKNLEFEPLDVKEACVYVGPNHPYYERDCVDFSELSSLRFIGAVRDYFSMEHHLDRVSLGAISTKDLNYSIYSNSDHMTINALMQTDLCSLGINFMHQPYKHYDIKNLKINGCEPFLLIGIVRPEGDELSEAAQWFIENFKKLL